MLALSGCLKSHDHHYTQVVPEKPAKAAGVLVTSLPHVPSYYIPETDGVDCRWLSFDGNESYSLLFQKQLTGLQKDALKSGDNAVVDFRVSNGTREAQGSAWRVLMTQLCGDDVQVAKR